MLDRGGVELVCSVLRPDMDVLEYGSGGSTTFFRWRARENRLSYPLVVRASCSFQSICQKLDKHGAWQQLGTKGISFHKKVDFCLMEGEMLMLMSEVRSHFIGRWKTPWSCCHGGTGWATTSCKETCLQNPLRGLKKNTGGGSKKNIFKLSSWGCLCRSYIDKPASLARQFDLIIGDKNMFKEIKTCTSVSHKWHQCMCWTALYEEWWLCWSKSLSSNASKMAAMLELKFFQ